MTDIWDQLMRDKAAGDVERLQARIGQLAAENTEQRKEIEWLTALVKEAYVEGYHEKDFRTRSGGPDEDWADSDVKRMLIGRAIHADDLRIKEATS